MFVGRIDFARMWAWGCGGQLVQPPPTSTEIACEVALLNRYFAKNNAYRTKSLQYEPRAVVWGTFASYAALDTQSNGDVDSFVFENAFRNTSSLYGSSFERIAVGDPYHQKSASYLWGFLAGPGQYDMISQGMPGVGSDSSISLFLQHRTADLEANEFSDAKIGFYVLLGSYFGDHYLPDDFMRATLATEKNGLAAMWVSPNPAPFSGYFTHWQFQGLATGDCLGDAMLRTIRDGLPQSTDNQIWMSILGDPTLLIAY
jgi:hypothetical protein